MIELRQVRKIEGSNTLLDIEEMVVSVEELAAVIGPIGSGRDLLFDLLIGRLRPTSGRVLIAGRDPAADKAELSEVLGVVLSEDALYLRQSVRRNLAFFCRMRGLPPARVDEALELCGLTDQAGVLAGRLSSGEARRLAFARSLLHHPSVLVASDPFARCDEASIALLSRLLRRLADDKSAVLLTATHSAALSPLCDTIYILERGQIVEVSSAEKVQAAKAPFKIPVRLEGKVALLNPSDILYATAEEGRATVYTSSGSLPSQFTLAELESRLSRGGFFRAHRAYLVNLQRVKEVIPYTRNSFSLILDDPDATEIPLSKSAAAELKDLLGY